MSLPTTTPLTTVPVLSKRKEPEGVEVIQLPPPVAVSNTVPPTKKQKSKKKDDNDDEEDDDDEEDEIVKKRRLLMCVGEYRLLLGHKLTSIPFNNIELLSIDALKDLIKDIQYTLGLANSTFMISSVSINVLNAAGEATNFTKGLGNILATNKEYIDTVNELALKYAKYVSTDPLTRLGYIVTNTVATLFVSRNLAKEPVPAEVQNNYNGL